MAKILLIEDHEATRKTLIKRLSRAGHEVHEAANGAEGIQVFNQHSFDLVILDFMMKRMNGMQAFEKLKAIKPHIPYILLTAYAHNGIIKQFQNAGGADFIIKPFREDLEERVEKVLGQFAAT
jgi:CheY-like chemotaxis protein